MHYAKKIQTSLTLMGLESKTSRNVTPMKPSESKINAVLIG